jgi:hypothetical protein
MEIPALLEKYPQESPILMLKRKKRIYFLMMFGLSLLFSFMFAVSFSEFFRTHLFLMVGILMILGKRHDHVTYSEQSFGSSTSARNISFRKCCLWYQSWRATSLSYVSHSVQLKHLLSLHKYTALGLH